MSRAGGCVDVLLVDDHETVLWGLEKLIDGEAPRMRVVGKASSARDALRCAELHRPHVILLDLDLGCDSGLALIARLRECSQAKIVILTGVRDADVREKAIVEGASGIVLKSEPAEVILKAVEHVHNGKVWLDRGTTARIFSSVARRANATHPVHRCADDTLTGRERLIVAHVVKHKGAPSKVIASALHISGHTLRNHLASIYGKLGLHRRLDLVLYAMERGLDRYCEL